MVCGREFQWRKKWQNCWHQVKYCSRACRKAGLTDTDIKLEKVIMEILRSAKAGTSICPNQRPPAELGVRGWPLEGAEATAVGSRPPLPVAADFKKNFLISILIVNEV